jgi:hypothetical protein
MARCRCLLEFAAGVVPKGLYLRVSTLDQTTANQERELREIADRMGCEIVKVYKDHGISGAKGRARERVRARLEALVMANATPRCGARSKRTGKPCRGAAMPNFSREAKAERSRVRAAILVVRYLRASI